MSRALKTLIAAGLTLGLAAPVAAQSNFGPYAPDASRPQSTGWTFTPTLVYSGAWDDNVLIRGEGDEPASDYTNAINPRASLGYIGRRTRVDASYDGAFMMYRELSTLNSYDQHASVFLRHLASKHVVLFANNTASFVPTTELVQFVGVPFVRTGSTVEDARGGVEVVVSNRTTIVGSYNFEYVHFDSSGDPATLLFGGHSHGGSFSWRRVMTSRTSVFADYDLQRATVMGGSDAFTIQNWSAGVEQKLSPLVHIYGAVGVARVGVNSFGPPRTGPVYRAGLTRQFRKAGVDVDYSRSFVPSYGFGGTMQNEEITGRVRVPLARRVAAQSSVSWRSNQALVAGEPDLRSRWIEASIGYGLRPWLRFEGFFASSQQTIDRPGGLVNRSRLGFQIVTSNPLRVR